ncbi:Fe-S cluster assembly sulfur transfer protein SufU [Elioraea rosea]|uniref:Fe-S cluster assembly sulfur transfer protein SufU n=1 Tax=Elioraea rosea TaxID=2492390 RepID=UPI001182C07F|nr:SUF system NifU family Fe-S cluster assembly protein [Elioraea rosea]
MTGAAAFDELRDLYQEVILDHGRHPRNHRRLADADRSAKGDNPMCGDRVEVFLRLGADGRIAEASFEGRGCAISQASASLMTELVSGRTADEAKELASALRSLARTGACPACQGAVAEAMERLAPLGGVSEYPSRVKCATLAWHALEAALAGEGKATTE